MVPTVPGRVSSPEHASVNVDWIKQCSGRKGWVLIQGQLLWFCISSLIVLDESQFNEGWMRLCPRTEPALLS